MRRFTTFVSELSRRQKRAVFIATDSMISPLAALCSLSVFLGGSGAIELLRDNLLFAGFLSVSAGLMSYFGGISRIRLAAFDTSAVAVFALMSGALGGASALFAFSGTPNIPGGFHLVFALMCFLFVVGSRLSMLRILNVLYSRGGARRRVAIYGAGKTGAQLAAALRQEREIAVVGFFDDDPARCIEIVAGLPVWDASYLRTLCEDQAVEEILLALPSAGYARQKELVRRIESAGLKVHSLPAFRQLLKGDVASGLLSEMPSGDLLERDSCGATLFHGYDAYRGRNILVTGAGGSIGSELCRQLLKCRPAGLVLLDISEIALFNIERELRALPEAKNIRVIPVLGSVNSALLLDNVLREYDVEIILHSAAYKHVSMVEQNAMVGIENNVFGTQTLIRAARKHNISRFVLVSSDKAVRPKNIMGATKRLAEMLVQQQARMSRGTVFSIVRFGNVLGSSGSVVPLFHEQIARGGPVFLSDEHATRYFMTVQEAAQLVLQAGSFAKGGEVFVLDMGAPVRIKSLAQKMIAAAGLTERCEKNPDGDIEICLTGLKRGEKRHEELSVNPEAKPTQNEKILLIQEDSSSEIEIAATLRCIREQIECGAQESAVAALMLRVSEPGQRLCLPGESA